MLPISINLKVSSFPFKHALNKLGYRFQCEKYDKREDVRTCKQTKAIGANCWFPKRSMHSGIL